MWFPVVRTWRGSIEKALEEPRKERAYTLEWRILEATFG